MTSLLHGIVLASALMGPLQPGPYSVGFRLVTHIDPARAALPPAVGTGRQVPIAIWYPAAPAAGPAMGLREYVIAGEQALLGTPPADAASVIGMFVADAAQRGLARTDLDRLLDTPVLARRNARPAAGRFPLVLFAHASVDTESVTAEYLASYGYVVAAVRSRGAREVEYRLSRENLDAMVADLDVAAARVQHERYVERGRVAVIGMSNGSIAAVALQLKRPDVRAIISLDGGIGENAGGTYLRERSNGAIWRFTVPLLHLYTPDNPYLNLDHLRGYRASPRLLLTVQGMRHRDFLAYPAFDRVLPGFSGADATAGGQAGFVWVNRYALHFLDVHLQRSDHGARFLASTPEVQGAPAGLLAIERLAPAP